MLSMWCGEEYGDVDFAFLEERRSLVLYMEKSGVLVLVQRAQNNVLKT